MILTFDHERKYKGGWGQGRKESVQFPLIVPLHSQGNFLQITGENGHDVFDLRNNTQKPCMKRLYYI